MADFLPRRDSALRDWTRVFAQGIQQDPSALGLSAQQAADYAVLQQGFTQALQAARQPITRGVRTVMEKDTARRALVAETRVLARLVRAQPGVDKTTLLGLGLLKAGGEAVGSAGDAPPVEQVLGSRVSMRADSRRVEVSLCRRDGGGSGRRARWARRCIGRSATITRRRWTGSRWRGTRRSWRWRLCCRRTSRRRAHGCG